MKNIQIQNFKLKEYKYYKVLYKYNLIKNHLENTNFILFFYYDFLNAEQKIKLVQKLKAKNIEITNIKNKSGIKLLSHKDLKYLKNLLNNNIILIYNKDGNSIIDKNIIKNLINHKNLKLVGALWDKKLYRPSIIKKYANLNDNIHQNTIVNLKTISNNLRLILSNLKK